jgi:hypothetical protein
MSSMTGEATIYNSTDGPLPYDRAGRMVPGRGRLRVPSVDGSPIKGHVDAERFIVVEARDDDPIAPALDDGDAPAPQDQPADDGLPSEDAALDTPADDAPTTTRRKRVGQ